jgi:hypothetical protein
VERDLQTGLKTKFYVPRKNDGLLRLPSGPHEEPKSFAFAICVIVSCFTFISYEQLRGGGMSIKIMSVAITKTTFATSFACRGGGYPRQNAGNCQIAT